MSTIDPGQTLAPSEVVFLTADQFLQTAALPGQKVISFQTRLYPFLDSGMGVSVQPLAELACMAAFLALQAAGSIRLDIRTSKSFFGLRTTQVLFATPSVEMAPWPEYSLENAIPPITRSLQAPGQNEVGAILDRIITSNSYDPFGWVCDRIRDGLVQRSLLDVGDYHPAQSAKDAAAAQFDATKALLVESQHGHPDIWDTLHTRVFQAVKRHELSQSDT